MKDAKQAFLSKFCWFFDALVSRTLTNILVGSYSIYLYLIDLNCCYWFHVETWTEHMKSPSLLYLFSQHQGLACAEHDLGYMFHHGNVTLDICSTTETAWTKIFRRIRDPCEQRTGEHTLEIHQHGKSASWLAGIWIIYIWLVLNYFSGFANGLD